MADPDLKHGDDQTYGQLDGQTWHLHECHAKKMS
jgi:hypothetical protein